VHLPRAGSLLIICSGRQSQKRPEGTHIKFRMKRNSIKLYDHLGVLRIETTLNNPTGFKILTSTENDPGKTVCRRLSMRKGG